MSGTRLQLVVLHNAVGPSAGPDELDVLQQVEAVCAALAHLGHDATPIAVTLQLERLRDRLAALRPHAVFNLVESVDGRAELIHLVPALLETLRIPYTGAPVDAMFLSSHKLLAKRLLDAQRIATPAWCTLEASAPAQGGLWIVKPVWEDASVGIDDTAVIEAGEVGRTLQQRRRVRGGHWFAERYIDGREFNLSLLADASRLAVLPVAEMRFVDYPPGKPRIVGYAAKWHAQSFEYAATVRRFGELPDERALHDELRALARRSATVLGIRGYARVDFRVDESGVPWVLEVNANPCLAPDAGFRAALAEAGISFEVAVERILASCRDGMASHDAQAPSRARSRAEPVDVSH